MAIPKVIHYCWFGKEPLSPDILKCIESWKKYCPDYLIIQWDESNYDYKKYRFTAEAYEAKKWAFVSDVARLEIVYMYGGFYLDTDVELIQSLDCLLHEVAFMGFEQGRNINTGLGFGAEVGNRIIKGNLDLYRKQRFIKEDGNYNLKPCPQYTTEYLINLGLKREDKRQKIENISIYETEYFCPMLLLNGKAKTTINTISIHHYAGSWTTEKEKKEAMYRIWVFTYCGRFGRRIFDGFLLLKAKGFYQFISRICEIILRKT